MIAVVDYGMGNLGSIVKAIKYVGGDPWLTSSSSEIAAAGAVVLPGVGAFGDGMRQLKQRGLLDVLRRKVMEEKRPFLGVCLGMQLLAKRSEEFNTSELGLDWIDAEVVKMKPQENLKVPHVGWNTVEFKHDHALLSGIKNGADFYFVHSYHMICSDSNVVVGVVDYGGPVVAAVAKDNIFATQFHPEKSQKDGLQILKNFISWDGSYA